MEDAAVMETQIQSVVLYDFIILLVKEVGGLCTVR